MTIFLRLLAENDKCQGLKSAVSRWRVGIADACTFTVEPTAFDAVPGKPFAYWVSDAVRQIFQRLPPFESEGRTTKLGGSTKNDFRFLRAWWEVRAGQPAQKWFPFAKGGAYSPFYADVYLIVNWANHACEIEAELLMKFPYLGNNADFVLHRNHPYLRPGLTWPRRTNGLSFRVLPRGCIFADKGPAAFTADNTSEVLLASMGLANSQAFGHLVSVQLAREELAQSFEVGLIQQTPIPDLSEDQRPQIAVLVHCAWSLKRSLDTTEETSHAFLLPVFLRARLGNFDPPAIEMELTRIQAEIDEIAFELYGFSDADRIAATKSVTTGDIESTSEDTEEEVEATKTPVDTQSALLSWAVGVAFGRFDWRLATGERAAHPEPDPFDPLPAKSPGMLPDGVEPFHDHAGTLVDDQGHPHDLAHLVEEVLVRVNVAAPDDIRRWLQREFFPFHLQRYSKSRRKAPIYWPLSTASGSYTLWVYYPSLTSQTLYTAINDFVEPKLKEIGEQVSALRGKGSDRSRDDEKRFETLQGFEMELIELRDTLLKIAPTYRPNHDDGVQICAAPLWPIFRHKPWQKLLKETWAKLEKGDYDWAHLAMNYWPNRVREKCKTDKSLAIAHGLEDLYIEPKATPKKTRKRKDKEA